MVVKYRIIFILFFSLLITHSQAQNAEKIDSLLSVLEDTPDSLQSKILCDLAFYYQRERDMRKAHDYAQRSVEISTRVEDYESLARANSLLAGLYYRQDREKSFNFYINSLDALRQASDTAEFLDAVIRRSEGFAKTYPEQVIELAGEALEIGTAQGNINVMARSNALIGLVQFNTGNYRESLSSWENALEQFDSLGNKMEVGTMLTNIGVIYKNWGDYQKATEYYQQNLDLQEELGDTLQIARALSNMGNIYYYVGVDFQKALEYYKQSLEYFQLFDNPLNIADAYNNIGLVYREMNDFGEALVNFRHALRLFEQVDFKPGIATSQNHMGNIYLEGGNYNDALRYSQNALRINREIGNRKEMASNMRDIGRVYLALKNYDEALSYLRQSLALNQELGHKREVFEIFKDISRVYESQGDYKTALENFKEYTDLKDSSISEEYLKQISELETKYETDRKERELELQRSQLAEKEAEAMALEAENKRQRIFIISVVFGLLVVAVFSILLYRQFRQKKRANILLAEQNLEISQQRDQIMTQKQEITDSITYASRIQKAILPPDVILDKNLKDHFIFYKPRDIVSGDYYWMTEVENKIVVVAADCTGHGVPGAFMSMLGVSFLNEIVNKNRVTSAALILNDLRRNVVDSLHQTGEEGEAQDGMDIALVVIDPENKKVEFAGAYNPLYLFRKNELIEYKADKMPIGIHFVRDYEFQNNVIDYQDDDRLYIFSDGYMDQFGGESGKKYMTRKFKEILIDIHQKPFREQAEILDITFEEWRGPIEQIDDVLVIGLQL